MRSFFARHWPLLRGVAVVLAITAMGFFGERECRGCMEFMGRGSAATTANLRLSQGVAQNECEGYARELKTLTAEIKTCQESADCVHSAAKQYMVDWNREALSNRCQPHGSP